MPSLVKDKKSGVYFIVFSKDGKRVWRSTKTKDKSRAYQCFLTTTSPTVPSCQLPLSKHVEQFLQHVRANFSKSTFEIYRLTLGTFLKFTGDVPLDSITPFTIDRYKVDRTGKVAPSTINLELRGLKAFFNCLKRWEILAKSPCLGIHPVRVPDVVPAFLTPNELRALLSKIEEPWLRNIVLFTAMTGLRRGEVLNLQWTDVDLSNRMASIHSTLSYQVKGGKIRTVPLNLTAYDLLCSLPHRDGIVFRGARGGHAYGNHISGRFRRAVREAGLDRRIHFHSLRHTFASQLVQNGISLYQVQKLLGHSSSRVTEVYSHLQATKMHDVVNVIAM